MAYPKDFFRFCPRCGSGDFIPQGSKSFLCSACGFNYYINSAAAVVALIFNGQGEILLTERGVEPNKGSMDLPGGFVDPGERVEEALIREIREELNLEITDFSFLVSFPNEYLFSGLTVHTTDVTFICKVKDLSAICVADDVAAYRFEKIENIDFSVVFSQSVRNILNYYLLSVNN